MKGLLEYPSFMAEQGSSFSFVAYNWPYHVFLSFRGIDTRFGFTNNLYRALERKGIRSFMDHEKLKSGEEISPALVEAIGQSRIAIIVFSKNYAFSTFCLDELVKILECIEQKGRLVWPIFYKVDPSNVRHQIGSYEEAFRMLEERFSDNSDKVQKWKAALSKAANLKGEHFNGDQYECDFIARIVKQVSKRINYQALHITANYLVGLESRIQNVISLLYGGSNRDKCMVGIYGIGGIGKSTIARAVFNLIADQFESLCFLANIRENSIGTMGLVQLQQKILFEVLEENIMFTDIDKGSGIIKDRFQEKKVLLVLDDIDKLKQLQALAGELNWFGSGSKIIITTRDKHLVLVHGVKRLYEAMGLNDAEAYKLFRWNAFKKNEFDLCYVSISKRAISYCKGLPLVLDIIGCNLFGKDLEEWKYALDMYEEIPSKDIQEILKVSYDGLEEKEKIIFLDLACFFKGYKLTEVTDILLNGRGFNPKYVIRVLVEKSLLNIDALNDCVSMHDLIQDMGKEIVRRESFINPGLRSRLWFYKDILHVLEENMGTDKIEAIILDLPEDEEVEWNGTAFNDMKNLKILIIKNARFSKGPKHLPNSLRILDWTKYPSSALPSDFHPRELVILNLPNNYLTFDKPFQKFKSLSFLDLSKNIILTQVPDVSELPNLRELDIVDCINLTEIHDSVGYLKKLGGLNVTGCKKLRIFPRVMVSTSLYYLDLSRCFSLQNFPDIFRNDIIIHVYNNTRELDLNMMIWGRSNFDEMMFPRSSKGRSLIIGGCTLRDEVLVRWLYSFSNFQYLKLSRSSWVDELLCKRLPWFRNLGVLDLTDNKLGDISYDWLRWFPNIVELVLAANNFTILPASISQCHHLRTLVLDDCRQLQIITEIPSSIKDLSAQDCIFLTSQSLNIMLSQRLHEDGGTYFYLPRLLPEWLDCYCHGSSLSFWFWKKFPSIALCFVHLSKPRRFDFKVHVNGHEMDRILQIHWDTASMPFRLRSDYIRSQEHVSLFDLDKTIQSSRTDDVDGKEYIKDGWNLVEVKCTEFAVKCIGVYVYKQKTNTDDVRFTDPSIGEKKRKSDMPLNGPDLTEEGQVAIGELEPQQPSKRTRNESQAQTP